VFTRKGVSLAIFLDSANPQHARRARALGFVKGITTNPALVAETGRPGLEVLAELLDIFDGPVFYQVTAHSLEARIDEAWEAYKLRPDRVVIKIPATTENLSLVPRLCGIGVAITCVFSPAQAYVAAQAGALYVAPYVNRATRLLGDGPGLVRKMVDILKNTKTEVLAASIKSLDEALETLYAGAHHLTLPLELIEAMGEHDLTIQAIEEFKQLQLA
jgi:transaldolase